MSNQTITITGPRTPYEKANEAKKKDNNSENIQVFVRCRPLDTTRNEKRGVVEIDRLRKEIRVNERLNSATDKQSRLFTYDGVFDSNIGQCEVYDHVVAPLIDEVLAGYNCTVFAYGQTGTGKTYTMEGERSDFECSWQDDPKAGIVPRALDQLFETLSESSGSSQVAVSYMELYNEKLYDLLNPTDDFASLSIYEDKGGKVKIGRLAQIAVTKKEEIFEILQKGSAKRQKAATKLNSCSSRSHTIFTVTIRSKDPEALLAGEEVYRIGKLNLVDLAGSENIGRSGAVEKRAAEAGNINKSLLTLGRVITSLVERQNHIPYRESKLTRLLQDSLGGGTKTSIIATISPNILDVEDTLSTLDYAQRAKKIQNKPEVNQKVAKVDILRDVEEELLRMRRDLEAARCGTNAFVISKENYDTMTSQIQVLGKEVEEKVSRIAEIETKISDLEAERERINALFGEVQLKLEEETKKRVETECKLKKTVEDLTITTQDRDEQKHLVVVHSETEARLKSQAIQLKEVVEQSTHHVVKLHEKVDRVNVIHQESVDQVEKSRKSFEDRLKQLQSFIAENFDKSEMDAVGAVSKSEFVHLTFLLSTVEDQVKMFTNSISDGITSLSNSVNDMRVIDLFSSVIASSESLQQLRDEQRLHLGDDLENAKSMLQEIFGNSIQSFSDQRTKLEELLMDLSQKLTSLSNNVAGQFASVESQMISLLELKAEGDKSAAEEIRSTQELIEEASKSRLLKIAQIKDMILDLESEEPCLLASIVDRTKAHSTRLQRTSHELDEKAKSISSLVFDCKTCVENICKPAATAVNELDKAVATNCQYNIDTAFESRSQIDDHLNAVTGNVDAMFSLVSSKVGDLLCSEKLALEGLKASFEANHKALENLNGHVKEQAEPLRVIVADVNATVAKSYETIENQVYSTKLHIESAQRNVTKEFGILDDHVKSLQVKKCEPTGETPQKTSFAFPTDLAYTSPHERILRRLRGQDLGVLDLAVVTELPECSDWSSSSESIDSCETTSSGVSNAENKMPINETGPSSKIVRPKNKQKGGDPLTVHVANRKAVLRSTN